MSLTQLQAIDAIGTLIKTAWDPTGYKMLWQNVADSIPSSVSPWARTTIEHVISSQASLTNASSTTRWQREGLITVQVFVPAGKGPVDWAPLVKILMDAFEGKTTSGIWFRNVRFNEIGPDGDFYQVNVFAEFQYDEIK